MHSLEASEKGKATVHRGYVLRISLQDEPKRITLKLEGRLAGPWVDELAQSWFEIAGKATGRSLVIDLRETTYVDAQGKKLLEDMFEAGAELVACDCLTKSIVEEIQQKHSRPEPSDNVRTSLVKVLILLTLPLLGGVRDARGQEKPTVRLTLRDAVQIALKQNPQVQIANLNVAEGQQDRIQARAGLLPQAGFETLDKVQRFNLEAFIGRSFPGSPQHAGPFQTFQVGPGFSFPLFDLTLWRKYQASLHALRAGEAQESTVREQTVLLVVSQYLGSLRAGAEVKAAQSRVELAQALYDLALDLQKHGVGTGLDTLRAKVQLQNEDQRLIEAKTQLETSLYGLVRLLNLDPRERVELADQVSFFATPEFAAEQSLEQALTQRPEMRALRAQDQVMLAQRKAARESRLPKLVVGGGWAFQGLSGPTVIPSYQYQATLDVPLFTGGRIRAEIAKADLEQKKIEQNILDLRNQIALEAKTALAQLESARHEVDVANEGVKLAQEALSQSRDRFQAGVTNNIEVITAQDDLARANDNQIRALYRYNQSRADLARATGQIETLYAK